MHLDGNRPEMGYSVSGQMFGRPMKVRAASNSRRPSPGLPPGNALAI